MFDMGFLELLLCAVIALLVLGPERLPVAARAAGRWIGKARRMTRNFTDEMERQLRAEELREKIRKEGSELGADAIQRNFQEGLDQARKYTDYLVTDKPAAPPTGPAAPVNARHADPGTGNHAQSESHPGLAPEPNTSAAAEPRPAAADSRDPKRQESQESPDR